MSQANQAFEEFLRGEDRLARLLCELPAYAPSAAAEFEAAFARAARAAQAQQDAIRTETPAGQAAASGTARLESPRLDAMPSAFEPPASLQASFLKMAARIDSAQAPRREAILSGIAKGDSPQATLGAAIAPSTEEWLQAQAPAAPQSQATQPAPPSPPARKRAFPGFRWFDLRLAALACVLAVIGTQLVLMSHPDPQQVAGQAAFQTAMLSKEASQEGEFAAREPEAAPSPLEKSTARALTPQPYLADVADGPLPDSYSPPPLASGMAEEARADSRSAQSAQSAHSAAAMMPLQTASRAKILAGDFPNARKEETLAGERATGEIALHAQRLARNVPAEAAADTVTGKPRPAMLAAAPRMAAAPAPIDRQPSIDSGISATLADDPARIAGQLPARRAGAVWTVYSSQTRRPELDRWLESLRQQIPESSRPARFELIRDDASPGPRHLRIVPPALP